MNRDGHMRKNFESILANLLARFLPQFLRVARRRNACRGQRHVALELLNGRFARRIVEKIREIEKTAQNRKTDFRPLLARSGLPGRRGGHTRDSWILSF